jgi:aryl-alcohol dehydrogenase-like predicted oxidoreductase
MEYRLLGRSGFKVPLLSLGTATFGGRDGTKDWGTVDVAQAARMVDICLDAGLTLFDSADIYNAGAAEQILGAALRGRRDRAIISTKLMFRNGDGPNDVGGSRVHLIRGVEAALKRLETDYIDIFQLHSFDSLTPVEETLDTLDALVRAGKIRYVGVSNYLGWQLMKSLAASERNGYCRYVAHQAYYSLIGRDYEWELMSLALDQGVGTIVWSPLGWGQLTGKIRRGMPLPEVTRWRNEKQKSVGVVVPDEHLFKVVEALETVAAETGKTVPQVALNWVTARPGVSSVLIGARTEQQLQDNLGAIGWSLTPQQMAALDTASHVRPSYPAWHQRVFIERNPHLV